MEIFISFWSGLDVIVIKSNFVKIDKFLEGIWVVWKIKVRVFKERVFILVWEEVMFVYKIFMILWMWFLLLNIICRFVFECDIVLIVFMVISLRDGFVVVRKEMIFFKKVGYCWIIFVGLDWVR